MIFGFHQSEHYYFAQIFSFCLPLENFEKVFLSLEKCFAQLSQNFAIFSKKSETMPTTWCELNSNI
jgi:hypothetical protein